MRLNVARKWTKSLPLRHYSTRCDYRQVISEKNPSVNAFVNVSQRPSLPPSEDLPLSGLAIAIKDNIATKSLPTTCSSSMLRDFVSPFDATVVKLLEESGADIIGKTNCDEFGMGSLNVNTIHGPVKNPCNASRSQSEERSAGGSSGGSAAAVAAGMCDAALGTDTGGSIRLPASYCGVTGLKPSYGLISRWGVVSYADSLDCVGILASRADTVKRVFDSIAQHDNLDPTSAPLEIRSLASEHASSLLKSSSSILKDLRIGIPQEYFPEEISSEIVDHVRNVIAQLKSRGAIIVPVSLPTTEYALSSYYVLATAEASSNLARYDGVQYGTYVKSGLDTDKTKTAQIYAQSRTVGFGHEVQKRILLGTYALSADAFDNYFLQAQRIRQLIKDDFNRVFRIPNYFSDSPSQSEDLAGTVDVLLHPSAIRTAPLLEDARSDLSSYVQDVLTVPASLGGLPALSVPIPRPVEPNSTNSDSWPIGISIVGQWGTDDMVLSVGKALEGLNEN
ncbi:amidase signature enzyme [Pholiota conissans]|uniref:Glutamyl-tRNA(Gln) amidotransferase subunit A, mitochondrial n=1 Tax=Pholiota conissans TaxID=109636 RepID=A0A9P5YP93_9AGAR|nr:amidase signature enzyme [Pholiota conissans]